MRIESSNQCDNYTIPFSDNSHQRLGGSHGRMGFYIIVRQESTGFRNLKGLGRSASTAQGPSGF